MDQATDAPLTIQQLEEILQILLKEDALPEDWEPQATTYDLHRFHSEAEFLTRFQDAAWQMLAEKIQDTSCLRALLVHCGHPYDYARLGHPLSTVYELYLRKLTEAGHVVTFASRTKAFLAPIEARRRIPPVRLYAAGRLSLLAARKAALRKQQVEIDENWTGPLPGAAPGTLTMYFSGAPPAEDTLLALIEARRLPPVRLYAAGCLGLSAPKQAALREQQVKIHENWIGPLPKAMPGTLTLYVSDAPPAKDTLEQIQADAVSCPVDEGGVLLIRRGTPLDDLLNLQEIQVIRKRTVAALLAANAKTELQRLVRLPVPPAPAAASEADCHVKLCEIFPKMCASAYFCTGLAAEAAVFSATAKVLAEQAAGLSATATVPAERATVTLFYADNSYGGTHQLITEILAQDGLIAPMPLPLLTMNALGQEFTLVERVVDALPELKGGPACLFLETPTNPELQVHDFALLMSALRKYQTDTGHQIPVLVDTTMAPLYPLFTKDFAQDWPFLIVKSGSKYLTKGKATLGLALCSDNALAKQILDKARDYGRDADSFAKSSQLKALAEGLKDLEPRMKQIAAKTRLLADQIQAEVQQRGYPRFIVNSMSEKQVDEDGLASGILSFYLPAAPTRHPDLVDEFVEYLLTHAPELVKNRVSYGQSSGRDGKEYFYVINPHESTQGSLPEAVKAAQKRKGVQICRISVPEKADVEGLAKVMSDFFDLKQYGRPLGG